MDWIFFTLLAIFSRATYSLATRILSRDVKVTPQTQSFLLTVVLGLLAVLISPLVGGISFKGVSAHLFPIGTIIFTSVLGNILYFKGQKQLDTGITQVAFSSILVWGTILSILFLNSTFSLLQTLGILLMLVAILLVQNKSKGVNLNLYIVWIIISAFLFAIFQVGSASISSIISTGTYLVLV